MEAPSSSQLILGVDKRNPLFTVYQDFEKEELHVYYGFELLEIVPDEADAPAFKMLAGRLYNAGIKAKSLTEIFEVDLKTLQRWGRALQSGDGAELVRVLAGRSAGRKLTPVIEAFVRRRWPVMTERSDYGSSQRLRQEIEEIFGVELSGETLRPLLQELKRTPPMVPEEKVALCAAAELPPEEPRSPESSAEKREIPCACVAAEATSDALSNSLGSNPEPSPLLASNQPKGSPVFGKLPIGQSVWCDHAGVLLFAQALNQISAVVDPPQPLLRQWSASLLLGAFNIEQTKFLNWEDLELLLGTVVRDRSLPQSA